MHGVTPIKYTRTAQMKNLLYKLHPFRHEMSETAYSPDF